MSLFMCRTDFDWELGDAPDGVRVFPSIEDLEKHCPCVATSCGIVEVRVEIVRVWRVGDMETGETGRNGLDLANAQADARMAETPEAGLDN